MKRGTGRTVCGALLLAFGLGRVHALTVETSILYDQLQIAVIPYLHSNKVVFQDNVQGAYRLYLLDVSTKSKSEVRSNGTNYLYPLDWGGTHVAWIAYATTTGGGMPKQAGPVSPVPIPGTSAAYFVSTRNVSSGSEAKITQDSSYKEFLAVDGNRVVWTDYRHFGPGDTTIEIYLHDLSNGTEKRITNRRSYKAHPHIRSTRIVWQDYRNAGTNKKNADIFLYDLSSQQERPVCTNSAYQDQPCVDGNRVVWQDYRNAGTDTANADIYFLDLSSGTEKAICTAPGYQSAPRVYGNIIVWHDYRNATSDKSNADIYLYDLSKGTENVVTTKSGFQAEPYLYQSKVVWLDYGDRKLYLGTIDTNATGLRVNAFGADVLSGRSIVGGVNAPRCADLLCDPLGRRAADRNTHPSAWGWYLWGLGD